MTVDYKEVFFDKYCKSCEYFDHREEEDPCYSCLEESMNLNSHKPVNWKEQNNRS